MTSITTIFGFNKEEVELYFNNLEILVDKFEPSRIYNVNETRISNVLNSLQSFVLRSKIQVGEERGHNITVVCCTIASGSYVLPIFIDSKFRMSPFQE